MGAQHDVGPGGAPQIYDRVTDLIGDTPLVRLQHMAPPGGGQVDLHPCMRRTGRPVPVRAAGLAGASAPSAEEETTRPVCTKRIPGGIRKTVDSPSQTSSG